MIEIEGISKAFGAVAAVSGASLTVTRGEIVALLGPSGCGKTTLLRLAAGYERPDAGTIAIDGRTVAGDGRFVPPERRRVGIVFQDYALFPHLTVAENIGYGLPRRARRSRVPEQLELVGLAGCDRRYPHELSGGQQQRVALARALAPEPALLLLDEPWSNIDPLLRDAMREELAGILRAAEATVVLVTHDREEAFVLSDRVALMRDGCIVQDGRPEDVYLAPRSRWAAEFSGPGNILAGRRDGDDVETVVGRFPLRFPCTAEHIHVVVRPELLELRADTDGEAEVVAREFRGHDVLYRVRLADGGTVVSQRPSTELVALGSRVTVRAHRMPVVAV